ncbi:MAG: efflux RND transporter periplasmic adaptor subunit [Myxococcota bacterium]
MRGSKFLPLKILAGAALIVVVLVLARRIPEERPRQDAAPLVRIVVAEPTSYQFSVKAFGSVAPRTESDLIPQVSGEILWISSSLAAGGFFDAGEVLARIDAADYRVNRETARAVVARTESIFGRAQKELDRQQRLKDQSVSSESRIDDAVNGFRVAEANLSEARARLERATRDLARTELRAPYRGRVRSKAVDVGQFVTRGHTIARLYSVDVAEIRLPVPDRELAFLDVPLAPRRFAHRPIDGKAAEETSGPLDAGSPVSLTAEFAGQFYHWAGVLVRTEAELDPRTRMVHLVAQVQDPFGLAEKVTDTARSTNSIEGLPANQPFARTAPLAVGLFVEAEIQGRTVENAFVIPRDALREGDLVYIVDSEDRIRFRKVEVLRMERENVIVGSGLESGERICSTPLEAAINGMRIRVYKPNSASFESLESHDPPMRTDESGETTP